MPKIPYNPDRTHSSGSEHKKAIKLNLSVELHVLNDMMPHDGKYYNREKYKKLEED